METTNTTLVQPEPEEVVEDTQKQPVETPQAFYARLIKRADIREILRRLSNPDKK